MTTSNILDFWPVKTFEPRESQIKALLWLEEQDAKYVFLDAPVGFGKSLVGITYSRWLSGGKGNSFILTPQIILQRQYENEKIDDQRSLGSIYGKSNYTCAKFNTTCDIGGLLKQCKSNCAYTRALNKSKETNNLIMNYTLALLMFGFTNVYDHRKLIICDEMHNLEAMLVNFNLLTISRKRTDGYKLKLQRFSKIEDGFEWMRDTYFPKVQEELEDLNEQVRDIIDNIDENTPKSDLQLVKKYDALVSHVNTIESFVEDQKDTYHLDYVMISDNFKLEFKPVYGKDNFNDMLKNKADKFLFMSGTILNKKQRCEDLGIPEDESAFLSLESEFPKDNRPVVYLPGMKMNAAWKDDENEAKRKKYLNILDTVLELHEDESGIIHTGNFKIAEFLVKHLSTQRKFKIYHHNPESGNDRNTVIDMFTRDNKPRILISPSITEGLDLKQDKGRFAIIAKIPYGYLGDAWIKRRLEISSEWYSCEAAKDIIQGCGRIVRSIDDYGTTYIIDESWNYFYYKNSHLFPKWWKAAYMKL